MPLRARVCVRRPAPASITSAVPRASKLDGSGTGVAVISDSVAIARSAVPLPCTVKKRSSAGSPTNELGR